MFLSIYYVADTILSTWQVLTHLNLKTTLEEGMLLTQSFKRLINWAVYDNTDTERCWGLGVNPSKWGISSQLVGSDSSSGWETGACANPTSLRDPLLVSPLSESLPGHVRSGGLSLMQMPHVILPFD